jgi:murein DD-endopeptidase MepM/ murein hydrolase activator NlpD
MLAPGESIYRSLHDHGATREDVSRIAMALGRVRSDPQAAAHEFTIKQDAHGKLVSFAYRATPTIMVRVDRDRRGRWTSGALQLPMATLPVRVSGQRGDSIARTLEEQGEQPALALMLHEMFGERLDQGAAKDGFMILVEKRFVDDELVDYGRILAVEIERDGARVESAYSFAGSYYTETGEPLALVPFVMPVETALRTSRFGTRDHPVYGHPCAHLGADFSAPAGTPVVAVRDGVVERASPDGALGNLVAIEHPDGLTSRYAHLERFARGVRRGKAVHRGQTIGFIGLTGLTTGPHLHFETILAGRHIDPDLALIGPAQPLAAEQRPLFTAEVGHYREILARPVEISSR